MISKISLGSVQFGLEYGIANLEGKPSFQKVKDIVAHAESLGIHNIDTASAYGNSEAVLGQIGVADFNITTKIPSIPINVDNIEIYIEDILNQSLLDLKVKKIYAVLVHDAKQLAEKKYFDPVYKILNKYKEKGIIKKIGISIYNPSELDQIDKLNNFDVLQSPYNIFDRRLKTSGWMNKIKDLGIEIQVRSIFLQGLLLMSKDVRPKKFNLWKDIWDQWDEWLLDNKVSPLSACLSFALHEDYVDSVVLGVDSKEQLHEIVKNISFDLDKYPDHIKSDDELLINPVLWSTLENK